MTLKDEMNIRGSPKIVLNLPLFNEFGIARHLKNEKIEVLELKDSFRELFNSAKKTIYICSPFLEYEGIEPYIDILIRKGKEGVNICILSREIDAQKSIKRKVEMERIYESFREKGVTIQIKNYHFTYENRVASSIHAKMIIVDNQLAYVGSGELRKNSLERNFEAGLIVEGKTAWELAKIFEEVFAVSEDFSGGK